MPESAGMPENRMSCGFCSACVFCLLKGPKPCSSFSAGTLRSVQCFQCMSPHNFNVHSALDAGVLQNLIACFAAYQLRLSRRYHVLLCFQCMCCQMFQFLQWLRFEIPIFRVVSVRAPSKTHSCFSAIPRYVGFVRWS